MKKRSLLASFVPEGMKHTDFRIGLEFLTAAGRWRCTDIGRRTIAAIRLDHDGDPSWYNGPPYAVAEWVFDEYDIEGLSPAPKRRTHDDGGRSKVVRWRSRKRPALRKALKRKPLANSSSERDRTKLTPPWRRPEQDFRDEPRVPSLNFNLLRMTSLVCPPDRR